MKKVKQITPDNVYEELSEEKFNLANTAWEKLINSPSYKLEQFLHKYFTWPIKRFFRRIKRYIDYAPIIWYDEDYDDAFIMLMLQYKIKRTREHIDEHAMSTTYKEKVAEMLEAETILDRLINENYLEEEFEAYCKKYPISWDEEDETGKKIVKQQSKSENTEWRKLFDRKNKLHQDDWNRLGYLISNKMMGWWD